MSTEKPTIWVGRSGATEQLVREVSNQLEKKEIVKVKILKGALKDEEPTDVIRTIVEETGSALVEQRGHAFVLYKSRKRCVIPGHLAHL